MHKYWSFLFAALFIITISSTVGASSRLASPDAYITVSTESDVLNALDGECSLREAVIAANTDIRSGPVAGECPAGFGEDDIYIPFGVYRLNISRSDEDNAATGDLDILESVNIYGLGMHNSIIDADFQDRVLHVVAESATLSLFDLSVKEGVVSDAADSGGAGVYVENGHLEANDIAFIGNFVGGTDSSSTGGAITASGDIDLTDCLFYNNYAQRGGGIFLTIAATASTIERSLFLKNNASSGGAIYNYGNLSIENTTFSQNNALNAGGGAISNYGSVALSYSTLVGNSASAQVGTGHAGALDNAYDGTYEVNKTILANNEAFNPSWKNCNTAGTWTPGTFNIEDDDTCSFGGSNYYNLDPRLGPLGDWGGPTQTYPLLKRSLAIDTAGTIGCPSEDQREVSRPLDGNHNSTASCDIGAYETDGYFSQIYLPFTVK